MPLLWLVNGCPVTNPEAPRGYADIELMSLLPHVLTIYPPDCPDKVDPATAYPAAIIHPRFGGDGRPAPARISATYEDGPTFAAPDGLVNGPADIPLRIVSYAPDAVEGLPEEDPAGRIRYIVSLPVALAATDRNDLLVVDAEVRDVATGSICGCRGLALVRQP